MYVETDNLNPCWHVSYESLSFYHNLIISKYSSETKSLLFSVSADTQCSIPLVKLELVHVLYLFSDNAISPFSFPAAGVLLRRFRSCYRFCPQADPGWMWIVRMRKFCLLTSFTSQVRKFWACADGERRHCGSTSIYASVQPDAAVHCLAFLLDIWVVTSPNFN